MAEADLAEQQARVQQLGGPVGRGYVTIIPGSSEAGATPRQIAQLLRVKENLKERMPKSRRRNCLPRSSNNIRSLFPDYRNSGRPSWISSLSTRQRTRW